MPEETDAESPESSDANLEGMPPGQPPRTGAAFAGETTGTFAELNPPSSSDADDSALEATVVAPAGGAGNQVIGEFEILGKLGQGGMGAVYRARQISLHRQVALKILPNNLEADDEFVARFQREARMAASLNHQNIVKVFASGQADGSHYIAMELVEGETLGQFLKRSGALEPADALRVTRDVALALQYGWNKAQLIHRDIKPGNIFLSESGEVKVGDLGLAKSMAGDTTGLTNTGTAMGTPHYISPEQSRGDKDIDFRADIYSLGCTLFQMLTGRTPYSGSDPVAVMSMHRDAPPPALLKVLPQAPIPLARLVGKMLKKIKRERQASYEELIAEIDKVRAIFVPAEEETSLSMVLPPDPEATMLQAPSPESTRSRVPTAATMVLANKPKSKALLYGGIAAAVAIAAGVAVLTLRPKVVEKLSKAEIAMREREEAELAAAASAAKNPPSPGAPVATPSFANPSLVPSRGEASDEIVPVGAPGFVREYEINAASDAVLVADDTRALQLEGGSKLHLLDLATGKPVWTVRVDFGDSIVPGSDQATAFRIGRVKGGFAVSKFEVATGKELARWDAPGPTGARLTSGALSPDGKHLALACLCHPEEPLAQLFVWVLSSETLKVEAEWTVPKTVNLYDLAWLNGDEFAVPTGKANAFLVFHRSTPAQPPRAHPAQILYAFASDVKNRLLAGNQEGNVVLLDADDGRRRQMLQMNMTLRRVSFFGDSSLVTIDIWNSRMMVWNWRTEGVFSDVPLGGRRIDTLAISRTGAFTLSRTKTPAPGEKEGFKLGLWRLRTKPVQAGPVTTVPAPTAGGWQPLYSPQEWAALGDKFEMKDGLLHIETRQVEKIQPSPDRAIRARVRYRENTRAASVFARSSPQGAYKLSLATPTLLKLIYYPSGNTAGNLLGSAFLPQALHDGDTLTLELRAERDRLIVRVDDASVIDVRDSRVTVAGNWGASATDAWYESIEVQAAAASAGVTSGWKPLFTKAEWESPGDRREFKEGFVHLKEFGIATKPGASPNGALRSRIQFREKNGVALVARISGAEGNYKFQVDDLGTAMTLKYYRPVSGSPGETLASYKLPTPLQPGDALTLEFRADGEKLTGLYNGAAVVEATDGRIKGAGGWGIHAKDGWFESVEYHVLGGAASERWRNAFADPTFAGKTGVTITGESAVFRVLSAYALQNAPTTDGALRVRAPFTPAFVKFKLIVRHDQDAHYQLGIMPDGRSANFQRMNGGQYQQFENQTLTPLPEPIAEGAPLELELRIVGSRIAARLNGHVVAEATDDTLKAGTFGMAYGSVDETIKVDGLEVLDLTPPSAGAAPVK